ncbi:DUF1611 domain-containing protein [Pseudonocardia sp.]|uniref:DUF1611 domain-containing protein n=1 Tax=Pseudonocardia sp. TaxID=60912 RepID=UPI0031FC72AC
MRLLVVFGGPAVAPGDGGNIGWERLMRDLSDAKRGYVTRRISGWGRARLAGFVPQPRLGDVVAAEVIGLGELEFLEDVHGRRARLYPGDVVLGAYGKRYATDFYEGYLPVGRFAQLLTAGGLVGLVASAHVRRGRPTELAVLGTVTDGSGSALSLEQFAVSTPPRAAGVALGTVVVVGSSMNAGKTTTVAGLVRGWSRAGLRVGAGKVTGSGSGKDRWMYLDAGAAAVADFLDFGMASTFGYPVERLRTTMVEVRDILVAEHAEVVVLEIADGLLQEETRALAGDLPGFADVVVLAVSDALGAVAGVNILSDLGVPVGAVSGVVTASPLAAREAAAATGLEVLSPAELSAGAALDLLSAAVPVGQAS